MFYINDYPAVIKRKFIFIKYRKLFPNEWLFIVAKMRLSNFNTFLS